MHFQVEQHKDVDSSGEVQGQLFGWRLEKADGEAIARSPHDEFPTESKARSHIAHAKKSMRGASRCKVLSP